MKAAWNFKYQIGLKHWLYWIPFGKARFIKKFINNGTQKWFYNVCITLHKKWNFRLRISSVNVTKSAGNCADLVSFTEEILNQKLNFFVQCNSLDYGSGWLFYFTWTVSITQIVLMLSSLWTANNAISVYVWYVSFSMCSYFSKKF